MKRILGIDFGSVRVGLALSDELQMLAHPLETVAAVPEKALLARLSSLVTEKEVERVVVGHPRNMDGTYGPAAEGAKAFAEKLRGQVAPEVILWDERLTSVAANRAVRESGRSTRESRQFIDQVAAQMILQGYLDRQAAAAGPGGA